MVHSRGGKKAGQKPCGFKRFLKQLEVVEKRRQLRMGTTSATHAWDLGSMGPGEVPAGRKTSLDQEGICRSRF